MKTLVLGASGATGKLLVQQLLNKEHEIKIVVRSLEKIPKSWKENSSIEIIHASILDLSTTEMIDLTENCSSIVSCLGHNLNWKGIYGKPRKLVTDAAQRLCDAVGKNKITKPVKYILMNTTGNRNIDLDEKISFGQKCVLALLRLMLPPHVDNEKAAKYLSKEIGQHNKHIEWTAVRPDGLTDEERVSQYQVYQSPTRSAIFDAGKTSRINVGNFMTRLIDEQDLWEKWKGKMPVIYNANCDG